MQDTHRDADGVGTWKPVASRRIIGVKSSGYDVPIVTSVYHNTGAYIDLPPGKWEVNVTMYVLTMGTLTANDWMWLRSGFSTLNQTTALRSELYSNGGITYTISSRVVGSSTVYGRNLLSGAMIINNTSVTTQRYFYYAGEVDGEYTAGVGKAAHFLSFGGGASENVITAFMITD